MPLKLPIPTPPAPRKKGQPKPVVRRRRTHKPQQCQPPAGR